LRGMLIPLVQSHQPSPFLSFNKCSVISRGGFFLQTPLTGYADLHCGPVWLEGQ
jgi:hypothetical protein